MLNTRARKIARNKQRSARRKQAAKSMSGSGSLRGFSRETIRRAPVHQVLAFRYDLKTGLGSVVVARELEPDLLALGVVLLDVFCLGVKNAFLKIVSRYEFEDMMAHICRVEQLEEVSPAYARKLVDGAIAYARNLGFEPHRDYADAALVFDDIDPAACDTVFKYGKDGKPFYISGPNHSQEQSRRIIAHLTARLGTGNFNYFVGIGPDLDEQDSDWEVETDEET